MKRQINNFLNSKICEIFLVFIIIINIICLGLETDKTIYLRYKTLFDQIEIILVIIFTIEYLLRLIALEKLKDALKPLMLIDLIAILPFYLPVKKLNLRILRTFRLLRILRMFKLARYFDALQMIGRVICKKKYELLSLLGVLVLLMFISSFLMYYAEADAQPDAFHNILDTFWWSLVTFTTVGYGDVYPITPFGKILSGLIVLIGIMLFALPTSIITAEFLNEHRNKKE